MLSMGGEGWRERDVPRTGAVWRGLARIGADRRGSARIGADWRGLSRRRYAGRQSRGVRALAHSRRRHIAVRVTHYAPASNDEDGDDGDGDGDNDSDDDDDHHYHHHHHHHRGALESRRTVDDGFPRSGEMSSEMSSERLDLDKPLWDLDTFAGRWRHFAWVTDFRTCVVPESELLAAKKLCEQYRIGKEPAGTTREQIIYAKNLYESAFHPDTGELQNVFGRMSFQVPGGMAVTGAMLQFYRTTTAVVFWQWVNQSFNALVNYTNRNANSPVTTGQLGMAYVSATAAAMITAIGCKTFWQKRANPLMARYVPFAAVAAANCANIPLMRQNEIEHGIDVGDENGGKLTKSKIAAVKGISQVVISRIVMCAPGMLILPPIMERLEKYAWMQRIKPLHAPMQVLMVGCFLTFMVPTACALFPQNCSIATSTLKRWEPDNYQLLVKNCEGGEIPTHLYFNKGL